MIVVSVERIPQPLKWPRAVVAGATPGGEQDQPEDRQTKEAGHGDTGVR
jgi:hypothetical protein